MLATMVRRTSLRSTARRAAARSLSSTELPTLRPWKVPVYETRGDYRQDASLEAEIGGPLYEKQSSLPRLPVPDVADTLARFLPTAMPLCETDEERASLQAAVEKFPDQASELQNRLLKRAADWKDSSWLQHWWNTTGYLQVRDSVVINVSYYFHLADDPAAWTAAQRGAALLRASAEYRRWIASGQRAPDVVGKNKTTLCSTAYKYLFNSCRIPGESEDSVWLYDPARHRHAVVAVKGHFFAIDLEDADGQLYSMPALAEAVAECQHQAVALDKAGVPRLGWLTASDRTTWAKDRDALLQAGGPEFLAALDVLQSGAVMLCVDDHNPVSLSECAHTWLHGSMSGGNRWFDKSIQWIVTKSGKAGMLGEHSMMDGMPVVNLADYAVKKRYDESGGSADVGQVSVKPIFKSVSPKLKQAAQPLVDKAQLDFQSFTGRHEINVQSFQGYGSTFIKKQAGMSPDAYVQMGMQLATYRLWGHQAGTYEATQVRPFLHGRTETTRSVSTESAAFVQAMGLRPARDEHVEERRHLKLDLLKKATQAHVSYIGNASKGQGVDRHFLGLSMLVGDKESLPDLYQHPAFARAKRWRVSTSHLTHSMFENWGYGEVFPDGVGLSYSIHPRHCVFGITALREHGWTDKLSQLLQEAFLEMRDLIEMDKTPPSKL